MTWVEGDQLPVLERHIDLADMVAYAGATWDWHRLHYDPQYLAERGLDRPVVDGQMLGALMAEQVLDAVGAGGFIRNLAFRFRSMVFAGETVRCAGSVTAVDDEVIRLVHEVHVADRLCATGETTVALP